MRIQGLCLCTPGIAAIFSFLPLEARASIAAAPAPATSTAASSASDPIAEAQDAFQLGTQAYALGNYDQAVAQFERSYALSGRPELLFNLGQAYAQWFSLSHDVGHLRKARKLYENYIKFLEASDGVDPEAIADTQGRIAEIDALLAEHDPEPEGPKEPPKDPPKANPDPVKGTPTDDPPRRPIYRKGWFWGVIVGAAVVIAAGVTIGVVAANNRPLDPELGTIRDHAVPSSLGLRF